MLVVTEIIEFESPPVESITLYLDADTEGASPSSAIPAIPHKRREAKEVWLMDTETRAKRLQCRPA